MDPYQHPGYIYIPAPGYYLVPGRISSPHSSPNSPRKFPLGGDGYPNPGLTPRSLSDSNINQINQMNSAHSVPSPVNSATLDSKLEAQIKVMQTFHPYIWSISYLVQESRVMESHVYLVIVPSK